MKKLIPLLLILLVACQKAQDPVEARIASIMELIDAPKTSDSLEKAIRSAREEKTQEIALVWDGMIYTFDREGNPLRFINSAKTEGMNEDQDLTEEQYLKKVADVLLGEGYVLSESNKTGDAHEYIFTEDPKAHFGIENPYDRAQILLDATRRQVLVFHHKKDFVLTQAPKFGEDEAVERARAHLLQEGHEDFFDQVDWKGTVAEKPEGGYHVVYEVRLGDKRLIVDGDTGAILSEQEA